MNHSDCDGEWTLAEIPVFERELGEIGARFSRNSPMEPQGAFEHTAKYRTGAKSLYDCFHNVDGENLFEALLELLPPSLGSTSGRLRSCSDPTRARPAAKT